MDFKGISDPVIASTDSSKKPGIFTKTRAPFTNVLKSKPALTGIVTVFMLFAVGVGVYLSQKPTQFQPQASTTNLNMPPQEKTATGSGILNPTTTSSTYIDR